MSAVARFVFPLTLVTTFLFLLPTQMLADCSAPTTPGIRICSPTTNAMVSYPPNIDFNTTPTFGTQILKLIMYDNGQKFYEDDNSGTGTTWPDGNAYDGTHHIVIHAWESSGKMYESAITLKVIGDGFAVSCPTPSSPGINFCTPAPNTVLGLSYPVVASAKGNSKITAMRLYVDGKAAQTQLNQNKLNQTLTFTEQGNHTISFVAWDSKGNVFKASRALRSSYTYSWYDCTPKGPEVCWPGFYSLFTTIPNLYSYVDNSFPIMAEIRLNPNPITTIKAYIDNTVVAKSNGPTMSTTVENAPSGTHIFTLQAWDTKGALYRVQYNININVPH
ncbi:MAG TPA: Ig-like domain-containing protein [Terriglobales bacterium]|nr:Ig-like domain-containing protein [Terriglobales bacterium]